LLPTGGCLLAGSVLLLYNQFETAIWKIFFTAIKNAIATGQNMEGIELAALLLAAAAL